MRTPGAEPTGRRARRPGRRNDADVQVYSITSATDSLTDDQSRRTRRYLLQMAVRMACFIGAVFADGVLMWLLLAGAVILPYAAVIGANEGRERRPPGETMDYRRLPAGPSPHPDDTPPGGHGG
ncbi:DUF3099 domain-containing protein [Sanguibacter suaedae]|uniref:DUF3099 domain-containing protein n=1 Tax=Sanguibacter suaedae TaxID=2795737 RepID=A0A934M753_9MICO|nr:DUF3099 domain-containing protein [Sanguibacter suaedae]MBI9115002.1 DUF3099 domain-containing protein [Sanguibacter suaedae]